MLSSIIRSHMRVLIPAMLRRASRLQSALKVLNARWMSASSISAPFPATFQFEREELSATGQHFPVVFGAKAAANHLGAVARRSGIQKMLVVRDSDVGADKRTQYVEFLLLQAGIPCFHYTLKRDCATLEDVDDGLATAQRVGADGVLAFGGGNASDMARAIAVMMSNDGSASELQARFDSTDINQPAPHIILPTVAGAGAEISTHALVLDEEAEAKQSFVSLPILAEALIVDPALAVSVPLHQTVQGALTALTQCIESYVYGCEDDKTQAMALEGVHAIAGALAKPLVDGKMDLKSIPMREKMALGSLVSGVCANSSGYGAAHAIAVSVGGISDLPHAQVAAAFAPLVLDRYASLAADNAGDEFFDELATKLAVVNDALTASSGFQGATVGAWVRYVERHFGLPSASALELDDDHVKGIVERAVQRMEDCMTDKKEDPVFEKDDIQAIVDDVVVAGGSKSSDGAKQS
ncbi:TPA: hypothetical protein N0F65_003205 [Lagenidium giganteum]|uniref:Alcohol dehydrogenase iron-type/glycerol dehydrogenase GldA domain-containing protein n=1 Tax=Lagenidium giganteum TaxID=4803 RepID=A0AAV2ZBQ7_9STRA|nr:TPA: hypothetical protein N0F65_003205 [Lagenidium giganteum]